jgi:hypothetical protein
MSSSTSERAVAEDCDALTEALRKLKATSATNVVPLVSVRDGAISLQSLRDLKRDQGCVFISGAFSLTALAAARAEALDAWKCDVAPQLTGKISEVPDDVLSLTKRKEYWPTGVIGNAGFGYLIAHPESTAEMPSVSLSSGTNVTVAMGSAYKANVTLVSHTDSQLTMAILFAVSENPQGMISQDFCKIHRGELTKAHVDIYERNEEEINRMQAIGFGMGEGTVRLCYLRFSQRPEIQVLVTRVIGANIFGTRGFQAVPKGKQQLLLKSFRDADCIQYGNPRDLVMWEPGVIHVEMQLSANGELQFKADKKTTTERYIVGTHTPVGFTLRELTEVAFVAERGFVFHPYNNANRGTAAGINSVHRKKTQWKKPRVRNADEKARLELVQKVLADGTADECIAAMPNRKRHCMGIPQSEEEMYDDKAARRVHKESLVKLNL